MTCQEVRENLGAYLQQKLSKDESVAIKQHLGECATCATEMENLRQVDIALEHFPSIEPSPSFDAHLFARLDDVENKSRQKWFSWGRTMLLDRYAWSLVVLILTTAGIWIGIRHQQYRELNSLQKVIEVQDHYLKSSKEKENTRSEASTRTQESLGAESSQGQKDSETLLGKEEDMPEEDKALLENMELLQDYDILKSFEVADHRNAEKQKVTD
jgi:putative zinc finger protein